MPQFDVSWFVSQLFWFSLSLCCFGILCSRGIIPAILQSRVRRHTHTNNIIADADKMIKEAKDLRVIINEKIRLAKEESNAIMQMAKRQIDEEADDSNNGLMESIGAYANQKDAEVQQIIKQYRDVAIQSMPRISTKIAEKSGIKGFSMKQSTIIRMITQLTNV